MADRRELTGFPHPALRDHGGAQVRWAQFAVSHFAIYPMGRRHPRIKATSAFSGEVDAGSP
jgi:hypothetical protein